MRFVWFGCLLLCLSLSGLAKSQDKARPASDSSSYGYLGVAVIPVDDSLAASLGMPETRGALVDNVQPHSPAAKAGLKPNDVVLQFDGVDITGSADLGVLVSQTQPGHKSFLAVFRRGKVIHLSAVLSARPKLTGSIPVSRVDLFSPSFLMPDLPSPALRWHSQLAGIEYEGIDSQLAQFFGVKQGVLIRFVLPNSIGQRAGLKAGDVLVECNGKPIAGPRELAVSLQQQAAAGRDVSLEIVRHHKPRSLLLSLHPDNPSQP
ncbi:MAG TPA: PDZ domain-containing protein [Bryobacteraceae bacterium]|nr:PDZ domain-containing protein [Bryobacteraceae bacterium]